MDPQLEQLEAECLDAVQDAEQLGLVLDGSSQQRVAAAPAGPERGEGLEEGGAEQTPDPDLAAP